jgi:hypothetical protein
MRLRHLVTSLALLVALAPATLHAGFAIPSVADNTLYQDGTGGLSNGAGQFMFSGVAGSLRRALVRFDVAGSVPAGATITNASLTLSMSRTNPTNSIVPISMHRVTSAWGEGTSDAGDPGGSGAAATPGDATWLHTFYPGSLWTTPGGDFVSAPSATTNVQGVGTYQWSGPQLVADVQFMLDNPGSNFGWVLTSDESSMITNAKRFNTRENSVNAPSLAIDYELPVGVESSEWSAVKALFR